MVLHVELLAGRAWAIVGREHHALARAVHAVTGRADFKAFAPVFQLVVNQVAEIQLRLARMLRARLGSFLARPVLKAQLVIFLRADHVAREPAPVARHQVARLAMVVEGADFWLVRIAVTAGNHGFGIVQRREVHARLQLARERLRQA